MISIPPVWRGEHGTEPLQTRLGSLTFVADRVAAEFYAHNPNDAADLSGAERPTLICAQLSMSKPWISDPGDPLVDFTTLVSTLGHETAVNLFLRHEDYVRQTNAWSDEFASDYASVADLVKASPESLDLLCVQVWPLLDCPDTVRDILAAGYDGAIYRSSGATMDTVEYRVFARSQIQVLEEISLSDPEKEPRPRPRYR